MGVADARSILVLEEQGAIAALITDMLQGMGHRVVGPADRFSEALRLLVEHEVDAAILDVKIEGELAIPVAEELVRRGIPWVFATGDMPKALENRYARVPVLSKPFSAEHLRAVLSELLDRPSRDA